MSTRLVQLGTLEALLTGREYELIVAGPRAEHPLAIRDGRERMVVALTDQLQTALAAADHEQLAGFTPTLVSTAAFASVPCVLVALMPQVRGAHRTGRRIIIDA